MKYLFILLLWFCNQLHAQNAAPVLEYSLHLTGTQLQVELIYHPVETDSTVFTYGQPAFGGQTDILKGLQNFQVNAGVRYALDSAHRKFIFYFNNPEPIYISYYIIDTRTKADTRSQLFRPIIQPDYLFIHGINLFLTPAFRNASLIPHVLLHWKNNPALPLFYTFDPENNGLSDCITTVDSLSFRFITGATDLKVKTFKSESGTNYLVLRSTGIPENVIADLEKFYNHYNASMRQYWLDKRIIQYSLVLQPFMNVDHKMSGVSFGNGFIGKYNKPDSLVLGERKFVIAHEIGHYYLGSLKANEGTHNEGQWFDEGFNDYTTYFNLIHSNTMEPAEFEEALNKVLKSLYTSEIKNTANEKIFENFWKLGDYAKLPYWRGSVFAFWLDNKISIAAHNKKNIRHLMLNLQALVKNRENKMFTNAEFVNAVNQLIPGNGFESDFENYILKGSSILFNKKMLLPFLDLGFSNGIPVIRIKDKQKFIKHFQF